jgi:hypothetical protein
MQLRSSRLYHGVEIKKRTQIKKPKPCFCFFREQVWMLIREEFPHYNFKQVWKEVKDRWKCLPDSRKNIFRNMYKADYKRYMNEKHKFECSKSEKKKISSNELQSKVSVFTEFLSDNYQQLLLQYPDMPVKKRINVIN